VKDPSDAVKAGQIVKVKVLSADARTKRIALSMKALQAAPAKTQQKQPLSPPSLAEKLTLLSSKWKAR
jgi:uncharacterized protein